VGGQLWRTPAIFAALAVLATLALAAPAHAITLPPDFEDHTLVDGLFFPTGEAWAPDGRMYVIQKDGEVLTVPAGSSTPEPLLKDGKTWNVADQVSFYGDRGLLGVSVDSQFGSHPYLYLLYTKKAFGAGPGDSTPASSQLLRVQLNPAGDTVVDAQVILGKDSNGACPQPATGSDCIPSDSDTHSIGSVRSAPDGTLYVGSGDGAGWTTVDPTALRTYDENSLAGKILHVDRDGKGLGGHPFCPSDTDLDDVCTKLFAKGFRNPYRFKLRPDGGLNVGDVGWSGREELDVIHAGGRNYGWPCYEGVQHTPGYRELDACQAEYDREPNPATRDLLPNIDYPHPDPPDDPNPPFPSGSTVLGGPSYPGGDYPAAYDGDVFVGDYSMQEIRTFDGSALAPFASATGPIVDVDTDPANGNLVYTSLGDYSATGGSIHEIAYSAANHSPVAHATADQNGATVQFDGSGSTDVEDGSESLTYDWNFGDGSPHSSERHPPEHTYAHDGRYTAKLTVTDSGGKTGTDSVVVQVGTPPAVTIDAPPSYRDGQEVDLHASATGTGTLTYSWQLLLRHLNHFHPFTHQTTQDVSVTPPTDHDADAYIDVTLTVTDGDGLETTKNIHVPPDTVQFDLLSIPAGAPMDYAGRAVSGPFHTSSAIGFEGSVSTAEAFSKDGRQYVFDGWDGGATDRVQNFTTPDSAVTMTARYRDVTPPIVQQAPTTSLPPPVLPAPDKSGPRLHYKKLKKGVLSGTVSDAAGVRSVYVALGRKNARKRCAWWATSAGRLARKAVACTKPRWIRAKLKGTTWTAKLGRKPIPAGSYRLVIRARDRLGNPTDLFKRVTVKKAAMPCAARAASSRSPSAGSRKCPRR
jgi:glucose/arabinose dehydrogenase